MPTHRAPRTLEGKPLRDNLDCVSGISGPRVESYDVAYTLVSAVTPAGDSTAVHSSLVASASSRGGTSSAPVDRVTTGSPEKRIARLVELEELELGL